MAKKQCKPKCCAFGTDVIQYRAPSLAATTAADTGGLIPPAANIVTNNLAVGASETFTIEYNSGSEDCGPIQVEYTITNRSGGNHPHTIGANGGLAHINAGWYVIRQRVITTDCDGNPLKVNFALRGASLQGGSEQIWVDGTFAQGLDLELSAADVYLFTNGSVTNIPASGRITTPINNQGAVFLGFEGVNEITYVWQGQNNVGSSMQISLYAGPEIVEKGTCDILALATATAGGVKSLESKVEALTKPIYRYKDAPQGVAVRQWLAPPDALPHDNAANIFTGVINPDTGHPTHPNAPTTVSIENDFNFGSAADQQEHYAWIFPTQDGWYRDSNGNTGERGDVFFYNASGQLVHHEETTVNSVGGNAGILQPVFLPVSGAPYFVLVQISDATANGGFTLQFSADNTAYANFAGPYQPSLPEVECVEHPICDDLPAGAFTKPLKQPVMPQFASANSSPQTIGIMTTSAASPSLPPQGQAPNTNMQVNSFADLQFDGFRLNIQNQSNQPLNWEALLENKPYASINNISGGVSVISAQNPDGTYNHLISSAVPLAAFSNINLSADSNSPPSTAVVNPTLFAAP